MNIYGGINIYKWWKQWLEQKNCFKRQRIRWQRHKRQITINSSNLKEDNFKNKENLSYPRLVFSIELGKIFSIGEDIQIIVLGNHGGMARLSIEAPPKIKISRYCLNERGP